MLGGPCKVLDDSINNKTRGYITNIVKKVSHILANQSWVF